LEIPHQCDEGLPWNPDRCGRECHRFLQPLPPNHRDWHCCASSRPRGNYAGVIEPNLRPAWKNKTLVGALIGCRLPKYHSRSQHDGKESSRAVSVIAVTGSSKDPWAYRLIVWREAMDQRVQNVRPVDGGVGPVPGCSFSKLVPGWSDTDDFWHDLFLRRRLTPTQRATSN